MRCCVFSVFFLVFLGIAGCVSADSQPPRDSSADPANEEPLESAIGIGDTPGEMGYIVHEKTFPPSLYYDRRGDEKGERFAEAIYRSIEPDFDATLEDLEAYLASLKKTFEFGGIYSVGDHICAMLYSPDLLHISDEGMEKIFLSQGLLCDVSSDMVDGFYVRTISIYFLQGEYIFEELIDNFHFTFVQSRRNGDVWAQPVLEGYVYDHFTETTLTAKEGRFYLLLEGVSEYPRKYFADIGYFYVFDNGKWQPANIFDACSIEQLDILAERGASILLEGYTIFVAAEEGVVLHPRIERRMPPYYTQQQIIESGY